MGTIGFLPDWRDSRAYAPLLQADRSCLAWEWLRRDPSFQSEALDAIFARPSARNHPIGEEAPALAWGLHAFEDPRLPAPVARPIWAACRHSLVLEAVAEPCRPGPDAFELERFARLATLVHGREAGRLLLCDGLRFIRLDIGGCRLAGGPVRLHYQVSGLESAARPLYVLQRFLALVQRNAFVPSLHPPWRRAGRQALLLRAFDALANGASQREIASQLLSARASEARWRIETASVRAQSQRLVRAARAMAAGEYWGLLR